MNPRQEIAQLGRNICVSAGAGAGKTTCLVDTYMGLLSGDWQGPPLEPSSIVAITFTDKAAAEMRARVVKQAAEWAQDQAGGQKDWPELLAQIEWAPISTIHSFCMSLLREFGASLGLNPDFSLLDAFGFDQLLEEVVAQVLRQELEESGPLPRLLAHYPLVGPSGLQTMLIGLHHQLATHGLGPEQAAQASQQAHEQALEQAPELVAELNEIHSALQEALAKGLKVNFNTAYGKNINKFVEMWPEWHQGLQKDPFDRLVLGQLSGVIKGNWYAAKEYRQSAGQALERLKGLSGVLGCELVSQDLLTLAAKLEERLEARMLARSVLSFDHLLLLANRLLISRPRVLSELRQRFRVLLVDEFQDVNPVQGRLIRLLAGLEDPPGYQAPPEQELPRLLLVGDRKQSIYAFRGADVGVFTETMRELAISGKVLPLKENFRSTQGLIGFFNRLFAPVFAGPDQEEQASWQVDFNADDEQVAGKEHPEPGFGQVQVLSIPGQDDFKAAMWQEQEARCLAHRLARLVREHGLKLKDIVLLFRRLTKVEVYERALAEVGLACYTVAGRNYYSQPEISDILMALKALLDPSDGLALAAFLRSPLVGLSDEAILALAFAGGDYPNLVRARLKGATLPDWLDESQQHRWQKARHMLENLSPLAQRLPVAGLIQALVEQSFLFPVLLATPGGEQKVANLRKLIELARQGSLGSVTPEFTYNLAQMVERDPQEPQAALQGEEAEVIRLMTIHKAKGLQFKLVVLPDLEKTGSNDRGMPKLGRGGVLAARYWDPLLGDYVKSSIYQDLAERAKQVEEAESARTFYVACTRAEQGLIFCLRDKEKHASWAQWVEDHVVNDPLAQDIPAPEPGPAASQPKRAAAYNWPDLLPGEAGSQSKPGLELVERCLVRPKELPLQSQTIRESVSGLEDWFICPRRYFFTRVLGLDTAALMVGKGGGAPGGAARLGSLVHEILERADLWQPEIGLRKTMDDMGLSGEERDKAAKLAAGFWQSGLEEYLAGLGPEQVKREMGFRLYLPPKQDTPAVEMIGEVDLLLEPGPGERPLVVDYKVTGHVEPDEYRTQLALYCLALWDGQAEPPLAALCYLQESGPQVVEFGFSAEELSSLRQRVRQAAAQIARLNPHGDIQGITRGAGCSPECRLAQAGLCQPGPAG